MTKDIHLILRLLDLHVILHSVVVDGNDLDENLFRQIHARSCDCGSEDLLNYALPLRRRSHILREEPRVSLIRVYIWLRVIS